MESKFYWRASKLVKRAIDNDFNGEIQYLYFSCYENQAEYMKTKRKQAICSLTCWQTQKWGCEWEYTNEIVGNGLTYLKL